MVRFRRNAAGRLQQVDCPIYSGMERRAREEFPGRRRENAMAMERERLEALLREAFPDAVIVLTDLAGDNDHWKADITSEAFRGVSRVAQHQMVYAALKGDMGGVLHALALTTRAPDRA
jgi:stress-induced morphogen